jgi:hypothetical protein
MRNSVHLAAFFAFRPALHDPATGDLRLRLSLMASGRSTSTKFH